MSSPAIEDIRRLDPEGSGDGDALTIDGLDQVAHARRHVVRIEIVGLAALGGPDIGDDSAGMEDAAEVGQTRLHEVRSGDQAGKRDLDLVDHGLRARRRQRDELIELLAVVISTRSDERTVIMYG